MKKIIVKKHRRGKSTVKMHQRKITAHSNESFFNKKTIVSQDPAGFDYLKFWSDQSKAPPVNQKIIIDRVTRPANSMSTDSFEQKVRMITDKLKAQPEHFKSLREGYGQIFPHIDKDLLNERVIARLMVQKRFMPEDYEESVRIFSRTD